MKFTIAAIVFIATVASIGQSMAQTYSQSNVTDPQPIEVEKEVILRWKLIPASGKYTVLKHSNLRTGPGIDHRVVGLLKPNVQVELIGKVESKNWVLIQTADNLSGYVYASLIAATRTGEYLAQSNAAAESSAILSTIPEVTQIHSGASLPTATHTNQTADLNKKPVETHTDKSSKFQLGYLSIGLSQEATKRLLHDRFYKVESYDSGLYGIVAGSDACFVQGIEYLSREQHESQLLGQLVDRHFHKSSLSADTQPAECIAVEFKNSLISGITHFSGQTNVSDSAIKSALYSRFGKPEYSQTSLNSSEIWMSWESGDDISGHEVLSAAVLYTNAANNEITHDNIALARIKLHTIF
jgi:uncharacterized protein YraI